MLMYVPHYTRFCLVLYLVCLYGTFMGCYATAQKDQVCSVGFYNYRQQ